MNRPYAYTASSPRRSCHELVASSEEDLQLDEAALARFAAGLDPTAVKSSAVYVRIPIRFDSVQAEVRALAFQAAAPLGPTPRLRRRRLWAPGPLRSLVRCHIVAPSHFTTRLFLPAGRSTTWRCSICSILVSAATTGSEWPVWAPEEAQPRARERCWAWLTRLHGMRLQGAAGTRCCCRSAGATRMRRVCGGGDGFMNMV